MNMIIVIQVGAFLTVALGVWAVLSMLADRKSTPEARLQKLMEQAQQRKTGQGTGGAMLRKQATVQKKLTNVAEQFGKNMKPSNEQEYSEIKLKLLNAGFRGENAVQVFMGIKLATLLLSLAIAGPLIFSRYPIGDQNAMLYLVCAGALGMYLPGIVLSLIKGKRLESIFLSLPDALDLMVVCVEAGLGLDAAMRRVASELASSCPVLCEEFAIANFQVQMGRPRKDVLRDLGVRSGVNDMRALAAVLIQAEKFGASIASALRVQSDSMRTKRRQLAEERAAKTAVKLLFPLILFIFPGIFVVLVGPAAIQISNELMKR